MEFDWYYSCNVRKAGAAEDGNVYINVSVYDKDKPDKVIFWGWLIADNKQANRMLSVALTAITTGYEVELALQKGVGLNPYNTICRLYLHDGPRSGHPVG